jgi:hypothetical protein
MDRKCWFPHRCKYMLLTKWGPVRLRSCRWCRPKRRWSRCRNSKRLRDRTSVKFHFNANNRMVIQPSRLVVNAWGKYRRRTKECKMVLVMSLQGMGREGTVPCAAVWPGSIVRRILEKYVDWNLAWCSPNKSLLWERNKSASSRNQDGCLTRIGGG